MNHRSYAALLNMRAHIPHQGNTPTIALCVRDIYYMIDKACAIMRIILMAISAEETYKRITISVTRSGHVLSGCKYICIGETALLDVCQQKEMSIE